MGGVYPLRSIDVEEHLKDLGRCLSGRETVWRGDVLAGVTVTCIILPVTHPRWRNEVPSQGLASCAFTSSLSLSNLLNVLTVSVFILHTPKFFTAIP